MTSKSKKQLPQPTNAELEILQVLWVHGPNTVRFVNDELNLKKATHYTSTLKLMQIMTEKGLLNRNTDEMKHVYTAVIEEQETKNVLLEKFVESMYNGSASKLMIQLLGNKKTTKKDLEEIRRIVNNL